MSDFVINPTESTASFRTVAQHHVSTISAASHVALVDHQVQFVSSLARYLRSSGLRVTELVTGRSLLELMTRDSPDFVLLAASMPDEDSQAIACQVRESSSCGLIIVTEHDSMIDRVVGLELGADDYVSKQIDPRELLARLRTVIRRLPARMPKSPRLDLRCEADSIFAFHGWRLDIISRIAQNDIAARVVSLAPVEFELLCALLRNPGRALTRSYIAETLCGRPGPASGRTIDVHIARLRKKLEIDPRRPKVIRSVRGVGYLLTCE
jgi:two-component system OmpR family response regulator